jgi:N-acetylglucosaminyl-diphospho-decaprenol L-rhamnosyltransferase
MTAMTAVIGNYNGERFLPACIESLNAQTLAPNATIVVDAASTDASERVARELGARFVPSENLGLGRLYNIGAREAATPYVFLANNDIALDAACLEQLARALDDAPDALAADARQLDWDGDETIHARTKLTRGRMTREHLPGFHLDHVVDSSDTAPTVCANGAAMMVRRDVFLALGGFDETFFMEWEDLDLCWRGWLQGHPTLYVPAASVRHRVGAVTTSEIAPRRAASSHHNILRFALKCLPAGPAGRVAAGELLRIAGHPRAVAAGLAATARELPAILRERRAIGPDRGFLATVLADRL